MSDNRIYRTKADAEEMARLQRERNRAVELLRDIVVRHGYGERCFCDACEFLRGVK